MKSNTAHLVITRLAIKWIYGASGLEWDKWVDNSIELMNKYLRPSLKQQTDQNFALISLIDDSVKYHYALGNEAILKVRPKPGTYPKFEILNAINKFINKLRYDSYIITRLDRDDCLRKDFIANVKKHFIDEKEKYIDIRNCHTYNSETGHTYKSLRYQNNYCSPFVSTFEKVRNRRITCWPYAVEHPEISNNIQGNKVDDLYALQVIHGHNISNQIDGEKEEIKLEDYF